MPLGLGGASLLAARTPQSLCKCSFRLRDPLFRSISFPLRRHTRAQATSLTALKSIATAGVGHKQRQVPSSRPCTSDRKFRLCMSGFVQVSCKASGSSSSPTVPTTSSSISEPARKNLANAAAACRRFGWLSFWTQLTLSIVSAIILLFSVAFTSSVRLASLPLLST